MQHIADKYIMQPALRVLIQLSQSVASAENSCEVNEVADTEKKRREKVSQHIPFTFFRYSMQKKIVIKVVTYLHGKT